MNKQKEFNDPSPFEETYDDWADEVGVFKDSESQEAWEHQQLKINYLIDILQRNNISL